MRQNTGGEKTFYVGGSEYQLSADGSVKAVIVYIHNGAYSPVAKINTTNESGKYEYYMQDHQDTPLVTIDDSGTVLERKHYDTSGVPVNAAGVHLAQDDIVDGGRDFTGHERVKSVGMLHANGRMLDELTGFISPDPVLFSGNLVSLNRYAYVLNSGPNHVDPTGLMTTWRTRFSNLPIHFDRMTEWGRNTTQSLSHLDANSRVHLARHNFDGTLYRADSRHATTVIRDGFMPDSARGRGAFPEHPPTQDLNAHSQEYTGSNSSFVSFSDNPNEDYAGSYGYTINGHFLQQFSVDSNDRALASFAYVAQVYRSNVITGTWTQEFYDSIGNLPDHEEVGMFGHTEGTAVRSVRMWLSDEGRDWMLNHYGDTQRMQTAIRNVHANFRLTLSREQVAAFGSEAAFNQAVYERFEDAVLTTLGDLSID